MFLSVKSCKREDLAYVANEIGENVQATTRICDLKSIILNSNEYKSDPDFVKELLEGFVTDRKKLQQEKEQDVEMEKFKLKQHEIELEKFLQQQEIELEKLRINS
ncbi:uncharacterized protein TNCT_623401 [Trichonephila clavata]|uniref:Uncharacterized protein n=1 Tax=Trichonephila clavata TaxID=2740835 RepID=A0A8X6INE8_TRICU|nr:uncharacterized protein TNCT_623401 [Trichonephila clavata]